MRGAMAMVVVLSPALGCRSDGAAIVLNVDADTTVSDKAGIVQLVVTIDGRQRRYPVSKPLPGSLAAEIAAGNHTVNIDGIDSASTRLGAWSGMVAARAGVVVHQAAVLSCASSGCGQVVDAGMDLPLDATGFDEPLDLPAEPVDVPVDPVIDLGPDTPVDAPPPDAAADTVKPDACSMACVTGNCCSSTVPCYLHWDPPCTTCCGICRCMGGKWTCCYSSSSTCSGC